MFAQGPDQRIADISRGLAPGLDHPLHHRKGLIAQHGLRVHFHARAQPAAGLAGAVGAVEAEHPGGKLLVADPAVVAGELLAEKLLFLARKLRQHQTAREVGRGFHRVRQTVAGGLAHFETVHNSFDFVLAVFIEFGNFFQVIGLAIHPDPHEAFLLHLLEQLAVLSLAVADQGGQDRYRGLIGVCEQVLDDLADALALNFFAAVVAVLHAHPREKDPQVVVNFGDRADRGARVVTGAFLLDGDGGGEPLDEIHVRLVHQAEELAGIGGKAFHVATLPLGIDRVEGQRAFAAARKPGQHGKLAPRNLNIDILQVVLAGAFDDQIRVAVVGFRSHVPFHGMKFRAIIQFTNYRPFCQNRRIA